MPDGLKYFEELSLPWANATVLVDLDGTLVPDNMSNFEPAVIAQIQKLQSNNTVYACTNSKNNHRNDAVAKALRVKVLGNCSKPSKKILRQLKLGTPRYVIGDKFLTDYLFARRIKAILVLVRRKLSGHERWFIKLYNVIDDVAAKLFGWSN